MSVDREEMLARIQSFAAAVTTLQEGLMVVSPNTLERDGIIQRFEYCTELSWKTLKALLSLHAVELDVSSPRGIYAAAYRARFIEDESSWARMLNDRNQLSHIYRNELADEIFSRIPTYLSAMQELIPRLHQLTELAT